MKRIKLNYTEDTKKENINSIINHSTFICRIPKNKPDHNSIRKAVEGYFNKNCYCKNDNQSGGRVWLLLRQFNNGRRKQILQVAYAISASYNNAFYDEIDSHIKEILNNNDGKYAALYKELDKNESLIFYEIEIDSFLNECWPKSEELKDQIYNLTKGYFAEALTAYLSDASEWDYYNSGMDCKAIQLLQTKPSSTSE